MPLPLSVRSCVCGVVLTCLATTGQHAAEQGFSAGEDLLSKALWNRSAGLLRQSHLGQYFFYLGQSLFRPGLSTI